MKQDWLDRTQTAHGWILIVRPKLARGMSALSPPGNGRAAWHAALRMLANGRGGAGITLSTLLEVALDDFPGNKQLRAWAG